MGGLVTLGEQMGQVSADQEGPLRAGSPARLSVCGAEATVAIGVRRLGLPATYLGRVGDDAFGRMGLEVLQAEGVDVRHLVVDPAAPTGLLIRNRRTADRTVVEYLRAGSAGSRLIPADIDDEAVASAGVLHVTGITPALGSSPADAVLHAVSVARAAGVPVSLDVNHRARLWPTADPDWLRELVRAATVVFGSPHELALLAPGVSPDASPARLLEGVAARGPREVVLKQGSAGATSLVDGELQAVDAHQVTVVDVVGAGDAFVAGYLAARLENRPAPERLRFGAMVAAFAVGVRGDWEGLPRRAELALFDHADDVLC
jgi:2-dehydro-3-deoxygluconokinase